MFAVNGAVLNRVMAMKIQLKFVNSWITLRVRAAPVVSVECIRVFEWKLLLVDRGVFLVKGRFVTCEWGCATRKWLCYLRERSVSDAVCVMLRLCV
jgi:hypothetical protein